MCFTRHRTHVNPPDDPALRELDELRAKLGDALNRRCLGRGRAERASSGARPAQWRRLFGRVDSRDSSSRPARRRRWSPARVARTRRRESDGGRRRVRWPMDHVGAMAIDPHFRWLDRVIPGSPLRCVPVPARKAPWSAGDMGPIYVTSPAAARPLLRGPSGRSGARPHG